MKFDPEVWKEGPTPDVLEDEAGNLIRNAESLKWIQALTFQLKRCYDTSVVLDMWDGESLLAWQEVTRFAGGIVQRSLIKELLLLTTHLLDGSKGASSIVNFHKNRGLAKLKAGPLRSFYQPLYREIIERGKEFKPLRDEIVAHTSRDKLQYHLYGSGDNQWGDLNVTRLDRLLVFLCWYVELLNQVNGITAGSFQREIVGAKEMKSAIVAAHDA